MRVLEKCCRRHQTAQGKIKQHAKFYITDAVPSTKWTMKWYVLAIYIILQVYNKSIISKTRLTRGPEYDETVP
jgi:hypothetical protein